MKIDACFELGYVTGTYGISGAVHILLDSDRPTHYRDLESVFLLPKGGKTLIPFFIQEIKLNGLKAVVRFEEITSKDQARKLVGAALYLPLEQLPQLHGDEFYYHELVGWSVTDTKLGLLGTVASVNLQSPQILLVMEYQGYEVLIPFTDEIVLKISRDQQDVNVSLPDGLLDVYLNQ
ncbi:MAG: ribosome maturation factor RimM [Cyclobacteriaceae bacterium]|nr:MAG: ribosome maturation factor RimM [Cyclobacteriaceae bacterium]